MRLLWFHIHLALRLWLSSPSVILQTQEDLSYVSVALRICCVLILSVFAVGMAALQDKLLMLLRRSPGRHSDGGWGRRWLLGHCWARLRLLAWLVLIGGGSPRPDVKLRAGRGEEKTFTYWFCHLMKAKLAWGRLGQQMLVEDLPKLCWGQGSDAYVTWHRRIRETMRKHASSLHAVTPRGSELWGQRSTVHVQTGMAG